MLETIRRLLQVIFGVGLFEFLLKIGWKWALALVLGLAAVVAIVLIGIAILIGLLI